jgi:arginyl-tRNA synthetase
MNIFNRFEAEFETITAQMKTDGELPAELDTGRVVFELPRDPSHGDLACNAAMVLAKPAGMKPRDLASLFGPSSAGNRRCYGYRDCGPRLYQYQGCAGPVGGRTDRHHSGW